MDKVEGVILDFLVVLQFLGMIQGILLLLVLFTIKSDHRGANSILAVCFLAVTVSMFLHLSNYLNAFIIADHHIWISLVSLLYGPLLYLYCHFLMAKVRQYRWHVMHFIPFFMGLILLFLNEKSRSGDVFEIVFNAAGYLSFFVYILLAFLSVLQYQQNLKQNVSTLSKNSLNWLKTLLLSFLSLWIISISVELLAKDYTDITWIAASFLIYSTGYFALAKPEVFRSETMPSERGKYLKSSLSEESAKNYHTKLEALVQNEQLFLDAGLTLKKIADRMHISSHHLSQVINQYCGCTFFEFINKYRIDRAKELLLSEDYAHVKITQIALDTGYNSISSFNKSFRNICHMTPSAFRLQNKS